jgi:hypothetical protein
MINLKLAEYNKGGKFQGLLELGKDFLFGGESVVFHNPSNQSKYKYIDAKGVAHINYKLDYKDPLKRCNGIFDGLTYGEGRFILIKDYEDTRMVHYNNEEITLYNIGSGYVSFSHGKYYKN